MLVLVLYVFECVTLGCLGLLWLVTRHFGFSVLLVADFVVGLFWIDCLAWGVGG